MRGPLDGVLVLDLSQVIAGPYGPTLLYQSGADVIKIEPFQGDSGRQTAGIFFPSNRGKRSIALDLKTPGGRDVLYRLAARADVLVENFRPGVMERLGAGYETLAALNPRLVYLSVTAFGAGGPYAHRPGYDPLLQAMTGIERAQGGPDNPPVFMRIAIADYTTALNAAAAITLALFDRERTGRGTHLQTSIMRSALFVQAEDVLDYANKPAIPRVDAAQTGLGPLDRMYAAADAWLYLYAPREAHWQRLAGIPRLAFLAKDARFATTASREQHAGALSSALEAAFAADTAAAWLATLEAANVPCAPVVTGYERRFFEDVQPLVSQYVLSSDHPQHGRMEHPGNFVRFSATPTTPYGDPAPALGQHTVEVLTELGYAPDDIERLKDEGAIR